MNGKKCFKCGIVKCLDNYYKHSEMADGHLNKYKDCAKTDTIINRNKNIDYYRKYDKIRQQNPERLAKKKKYFQKFKKLHPEKIKEYYNKWNDLNKEKRNAYKVVWSTIKNRPKKCIICGSEPKKIYAHHPDYSQPLFVIWLCNKCHVAVHWRGKSINHYMES